MRAKGQGAVDDHGLDLGYAAGARRTLDHLGSILRPGERIVCGAQGFLEGRPGVVVATSSRFMFVYRDETPIDSPYEEITRFRAKVGIVASDLEIEDANGIASIRQIHPRARLADLAGILQKGPGSVGPGTPAVPGSGIKGPGPQVQATDGGNSTGPAAAGLPATGGSGAGGSGAGGAGTEDWKPKLRPKISPLGPRHDEGTDTGGPVAAPVPEPPRAASAGIGGVAGAAPAPTSAGPPLAPVNSAGPPAPSAQSPSNPVPVLPRRPPEPSWQPKLGVIGPPGEPPAPISLSSRGSALTNKATVPLALTDQLLPGEWVVATFTDLTATTEGHEREASASAAVTNRRLLLLTPSGTPVEAWPLQGVEVQESAGGGRARLVGGIDLEFTSSELAAGFSEAMRNATGLLGS